MTPELTDVNLVRAAVLAAAAVAAMVTDVRARRIPNALTLPVAVLGLGIGAVSAGPAGFALAVAGLLAGAALFFVPATRFGWGLGDLKLMAALGAVGGPVFALWLALYALAAGGLFSLVWLTRQGQLTQVAAGMRRDLRAGQILARSGLAIPFAVPIAAGVLVALLVSPGLPR